MTNEDKIKNIMENFDFERVHKTMKKLNWKWFISVEEGERVPTLNEIKETALKMLHDAIEKYSYSTGGFSVKYNKDTGRLSLSFVVEEWDEV